MSSWGSQNEAKIAPWRPPGRSLEAPWSPLGGPGAPREILERFWVPLGGLWGPQNCFKSMLQFILKSSSALGCHFGPPGSVLGSMFGSFWDRFGLWLAVRPPNTKTLIFDDTLTRNRVFCSSLGVRKSVQNRSREPLGAEPGSKGVLEASWDRFLDPLGVPKRTPKGVWKAS